MTDRPAASVNVVPVPIRDGVAAMVQVPFDLTRAEAEKIARVVLALANDGELSPQKTKDENAT